MPTLPELAARAGLKEMRPTGDQVLALSDLEVGYAIAGSDRDGFRVERSSRGGRPVLMIGGTDRATAERFLAARLASDLRFAAGLPALRPAGLAPGVTLADERDGVRMTWASGTAVLPATRTAGSDAIAFAPFVTGSIDDIVRAHNGG